MPAAAGRPGRLRAWLVGLLRLAVGVALLVFLFRSMDVDKALEGLRQMRPLWLGLAALVILSIRVVFAWRWKILLVDRGFDLSILHLTRVIFISMFFGSFLPGVFGSDLVRAYRVARSHGRAGAVAGTLLVDRILGVYALGVVALAAALADLAAGGNAHGLLLPLLVFHVAALVGGGGALILSPRLRRLTPAPGSRLARLWARLLDAGSQATDPATLRRVFLPVMGLSLLVVLLRCTIFFCLYRAFAADVTPVDTLMFVPLVFVAILVPVSIGGIGVRETALVYLFGTVGVPTEASVSAGLMFQVLQVICSLPGVLLWLGERSRDGGADAPERG